MNKETFVSSCTDIAILNTQIDEINDEGLPFQITFCNQLKLLFNAIFQKN